MRPDQPTADLREPLLVATALAWAAARSAAAPRVRTAESCTGGLLASWLTCLSGSSRWFEGGVVSYANDRKVGWLGVNPELLAQHGAVSEPVARAMVAGLLAPGTEGLVGVAITGIAGPGGGSPEKPVGLVWFAWQLAGQPAQVARLRLPGDRWQVQRQAARVAASGLFGLMIRSSGR
ncbi:MAG: hypothetical protein RL483_587 [Pseudomonadota bacterium]|jgi:nicotinamide-nucleotide amidase